MIAIHFGNPKLNGRAVILELSFITLSFLVLWRGYSKALYACIPLSLLVIIGNSLVPHTHTCSSHDDVFQTSKCNCADCRWGYVLQIDLIYTGLSSILNIRSKRL